MSDAIASPICGLCTLTATCTQGHPQFLFPHTFLPILFHQDNTRTRLYICKAEFCLPGSHDISSSIRLCIKLLPADKCGVFHPNS